MDRLTPARRAQLMSRIKSKDTSPEMAVRRIVFRFGFRYRLHDHSLPGRPDMVFRSAKKIIFIHGCFWHSHGCLISHIPKSRKTYWGPKLARTKSRDRVHQRTLARMGWQCLTVWECEVRRDLPALTERVLKFLGSSRRRAADIATGC
ncbi:MAG: very short patch repair endonuclease [Bryobacteraceae bacterium]